MAKLEKYCPEFRVEIDGDKLPTALNACISSVTYQDGLEGADRVEVTFANPDLRWLNEPLLQIDRGFRLAIGYQPDPLEEVFVGEVTGVEPSFPNSGMPTVKVVAHDFLQRLAHGTKSRGFRIHIPSLGNIPLPDTVATAIVSATNMLVPMPDPVGGSLSMILTIATIIFAPQVAQQGVPMQQGESDFDFLQRIAKQNGWEMFIDHTLEPRGRVLRFKFLVQDYDSSLTLMYGASLMDFNAKLTTVGDIFGVCARIWVPMVQMEFVIVVSWDYDRAAFNLAIYPNIIGEVDESLEPMGGGKTLDIAPVGFPQCLQSILGELLPRLNNRLTGSGSTIGDPRIKAGEVVNLKGLGNNSAAEYRITSATHTLDSGGYRTQFEARKEVWFQDAIPVPEGTSGLARIHGESLS